MKKVKTRSKSSLAFMTSADVDLITKHAENRTDVPLVASKQVNMRLNPETMARARKLAAAQGKPVTTFLATLLNEDVERLWSVYKKVD
jgi:predicted HicB family RNase H-like nuclease